MATSFLYRAHVYVWTRIRVRSRDRIYTYALVTQTRNVQRWLRATSVPLARGGTSSIRTIVLCLSCLVCERDILQICNEKPLTRLILAGIRDKDQNADERLITSSAFDRWRRSVVFLFRIFFCLFLLFFLSKAQAIFILRIEDWKLRIGDQKSFLLPEDSSFLFFSPCWRKKKNRRMMQEVQNRL